jgi:signal transduction histidine kinase
MRFVWVLFIGVSILLAVLMARRMPRSQAGEILTRTTAYLGWGPLLLVAALMNMQLWGMSLWTGGLLLLAAVLVVATPALAAELAAAGFVIGGLYGILLGAFWQSVFMPHRAWHSLIYGTIMVSSWNTAVLAAVEGLAFAGLGLWLVPRTLGRRRWMVALAAAAPWLARLSVTGAGGPAGHRPRSTRLMLIKALRGRLHEIGWAAALPVAVLALPLSDQDQAAVVTVVVAAALALLLPAVAARILPFMLAVLGLFGIYLAMKWSGSGQLVLYRDGQLGQFSYRMYGTAYVDSGVQAGLAGTEGLALLIFAFWLAPRTFAGRGQLAALAGRIQRLAQTRNDAVDVAAAELRRVERDLHDGAQARLVAVGMSLRAAEHLIGTNPAAAQALVAEARQASSRALTDLRDLVRGIYPPVLADRGLGDAVQALALDTPIRTDVEVGLPGRPARPVESAVYFAVAEALANAVKHAGARQVQIRLAHAGGMLRAEVTDDGAGGADPAGGTGLAGIERRLGTFDGILAISSPPGGPTIVVIEVPCELSSPRTYTC